MSVLTEISRPAICDRALDRARSIPVPREEERSRAFEMQTSRRGAIPDYIAESSGLCVRRGGTESRVRNTEKS